MSRCRAIEILISVASAVLEHQTVTLDPSDIIEAIDTMRDHQLVDQGELSC